MFTVSSRLQVSVCKNVGKTSEGKAVGQSYRVHYGVHEVSAKVQGGCRVLSTLFQRIAQQLRFIKMFL